MTELSIRPITYQELPDVAALAHSFAIEQSSKFHVGEALRWIEAWFLTEDVFYTGLYDGEKLVGALLAINAPEWYSGERVAQELGWYVRKEYRGSLASVRLFNKFLDWAQGKNIRIAYRMVGPDLHNFYTRHGLHKVEHVYERSS